MQPGQKLLFDILQIDNAGDLFNLTGHCFTSCKVDDRKYIQLLGLDFDFCFCSFCSHRLLSRRHCTAPFDPVGMTRIQSNNYTQLDAQIIGICFAIRSTVDNTTMNYRWYHSADYVLCSLPYDFILLTCLLRILSAQLLSVHCVSFSHMRILHW